jgi:hypothetical protein
MRLHGGKFEAPLSCHLEPTNLALSLPYEALSYVWGTKYSSEYLKLHDFSLESISNLEVALRHLRHPTNERVL